MCGVSIRTVKDNPCVDQFLKIAQSGRVLVPQSPNAVVPEAVGISSIFSDLLRSYIEMLLVCVDGWSRCRFSFSLQVDCFSCCTTASILIYLLYTLPHILMSHKHGCFPTFLSRLDPSLVRAHGHTVHSHPSHLKLFPPTSIAMLMSKHANSTWT